MSRILVTGGLGYIGSHTIVDLLQAGHEVVSLDNEINSSIQVLDGIEAITGKRIENIHVDLSNTWKTLEAVSNQRSFDAIMHFAALKSVEESVVKPTLYFQNNVGATITTMVLMDQMKISNLIFSSSCTVYGIPDTLPVTEDSPMSKAESPYGASKQACEILYDQYFRRAENKKGITLRYFNPAGAHFSGLIGESPVNKPTNLVPVITSSVAAGKKEMTVYGNDYPTRDGSCVRDYIHILDLARAHTLSLEYLLKGKSTEPYGAYNLGIGQGVTVLEAIHAFEEATNERVNYKIGPRRPGDVPAIYSNHARISDHLGWKPEYDIHDIMRTAWEWEKRRSRINTS